MSNEKNRKETADLTTPNGVMNTAEINQYGGDRYVKHFTCWNQLLVMMFGHLTNRITGGTLQEPMAGKC